MKRDQQQARQEHEAFGAEPALADTLRLLLPEPELTLLLRAALGGPEQAARAWRQWLEQTPQPKRFLMQDRVGIKRHLPMLYHNLSSAGDVIGRDLEPYLRTARMREDLRSVRYRRALAEALQALHGAAIDFVLLKGAALGETLFDTPQVPVLRHSHDVDVLVSAAQRDAAAGALASAGFAPHAGNPSRDTNTVRLDHSSGLPIELHTQLFMFPFYAAPLAEVLQRSAMREVLGVPARVLSPADMLAHVLGHASTTPRRITLSWIIDSVLLLRHRAVQWPVFADVIGQSGLSLPVLVMLRYLQGELDADVPAEAIADLHAGASQAGALQQAAALEGLTANRRLRLQRLLQASSRRSQLAVLRWAVAPPWRYGRWCAGDSTWRGVAWYAARPLRLALPQIRKRLRPLSPAAAARTAPGPAGVTP